jgi:hypothetical protein
MQAAKARIDQTKLQAERIVESVKAEVIQAREAVLTAQEQIEAAHRGVQAAEASLALSQVRLEGGVGLTLEVLEAQEALTTARTALVGAIAQYNKEEAGLLRAIGEMSATALGLANSDRKATISLTMRADGNPSLDLTDQDGKPRVTLRYAELEVSPGRITDKLPVFSVVLSDPSGRVIWKAP